MREGNGGFFGVFGSPFTPQAVIKIRMRKNKTRLKFNAKSDVDIVRTEICFYKPSRNETT